MEKYNYTRVSDFIRDAVLDKRLTQRQVVDAIRTYDFRLVRAITALRRSAQYPIRRSGTDPYARQATPLNRSRPRRQNRVADPVYGGEKAGGGVM